MTNDKWHSLSLMDPFVRTVGKTLFPISKTKRDDVIAKIFVSGADGGKAGFDAKTEHWTHKGLPKHEVPMTGKMWIGPVKLDDSTGLQLIQVGLPVLDGGKRLDRSCSDCEWKSCVRAAWAGYLDYEACRYSTQDDQILAASVAITVGPFWGCRICFESPAAARSTAAVARAENHNSFELLDLVLKVQSTTQKVVQERDPDAIESLIHQNEALVKEAKTRIQGLAEEGTVAAAFDKLVQANDEVKDLLLHAHNAESHQAIIEKSNPAFEAVSQPSPNTRIRSGRTLMTKLDGHTPARSTWQLRFMCW